MNISEEIEKWNTSLSNIWHYFDEDPNVMANDTLIDFRKMYWMIQKNHVWLSSSYPKESEKGGHWWEDYQYVVEKVEKEEYTLVLTDKYLILNNTKRIKNE